MTTYRTIRAEAAAEFTERRSRFIGTARPVKTEAVALAFIAEVKARHREAAHNVYAYSLRDGLRRCTDDGEPQGTAGVPVLDTMQKAGVTDAAVVVTRYFGGVLLGAGGLVRAYSHGAGIALAAAGAAEMRLCLRCALVCSYAQYGRVAALVPESGAVADGADFGEAVRMEFHLAPELLAPLKAAVADATCGESEVVIVGEAFYEVQE